MVKKEMELCSLYYGVQNQEEQYCVHKFCLEKRVSQSKQGAKTLLKSDRV